MIKKLCLICLLLLLTGVFGVAAQDSGGSSSVSEGVVITWPPPVSEVWGTGDVTGTAAVQGMAYYYLEYLPLNDDLSEPSNAPWLPATVAISKPVVNGVLATLDTTTVTDGLYALRLQVNTLTGQNYTYKVEPVRVNNARFTAFEASFRDRILQETGAGAQPTATPVIPATAVPTQAPNVAPYVMANVGLVSVNIRRCDLTDNYRCAILGFLQAGEQGTITARSSNGSGWFQIRNSAGLVGWVSPTVVTVSGNPGGLPSLAPPAPLPPPAVSNVTVNGISISGATTCNQSFNVQVNVANTGNAASPGGQVSLQDVNLRTGEVTFTNYGNYPSINPGGNYIVTIPVTVTAYYNEQHQLTARTNNQQVNANYALAQGSCGAAPTPRAQDNSAFASGHGAGSGFVAGQCELQFNSDTNVWDSPNGNVVGTVPAGTSPAQAIAIQNGVIWYQFSFADAANWVPGSIVGTFGPCS